MELVFLFTFSMIKLNIERIAFMGNLRVRFSTIRSRILISNVMVIAAISIIVILICYNIVSYNLQRNLIQTSETRLSFLCSSIDSNINDTKSYFRSCQINSKVVDFALEENPQNNITRREAHDIVSESYKANSSLFTNLVRMVIIGNTREDIVQVVESTSSASSVSKDSILSLSYFEKLRTNNNDISVGIMQDPFFYTKNIPMIPFVYPIHHPYNADEIGYIFAEMSTAVITEPIQNYLLESDSRFYIHIGDNTYQYLDNSLVLCDTPYEVVDDLSEYALNTDSSISRAKSTEDNQLYIIISRPLENEGWYVTESVDALALSKSIFASFLFIVMVIISIAAIICSLLSLFLSKTVNVPVKQLQIRMKRIEQGDFSRDPSTEWNHELGDIGKSINNLTENVLQLMNQKIEDEKQKKDYEYKMLQSQINPHFLYNTLNSIKWMATIQGATGISEMTTSLSRLLKDISKGTSNLISIQHELDLIKDYFTIQQYRYGGTITMDICIDDENLVNQNILKFTLQPIVENAIFHGIEPKGTTGKIEIHIYQEPNQNVRIDVTDDGVGMSEEQIPKLLTDESSRSSNFFKEIGISNVHKRLQYEFGADYGLSVISEKGKFTTISILLPFKESKEIYD